MRDRKHVFFNKKQKLGGAGGGADARGGAAKGAGATGVAAGAASAAGGGHGAGAGPKGASQASRVQKSALSFVDEEEEGL